MIIPFTSEGAELFREVCSDSTYTTEQLAERFRTAIPPPPHHEQASEFAELAEPTSPFLCLARCFFLGLPVDAGTAEEFLSSPFLEICLGSGILRRDSDSLIPQALVVPVGPRLLASDLHESGKVQVDVDSGWHVQTVSDPGLHVLKFAVQQPVKSMLDLFGGGGLHGLFASGYSQSVTTTDLNPRAKPFADFNIALNGCNNMTAVTGDLFSAVEDQRFDLILANPPYVISPSESAGYRENPMALDGFLQRLLRQVPRYLEEGGIFQAVCEWVEIDGQDWRERFQSWLVDCGCDAWVLAANRQLPESYAHRRARETIVEASALSTARANWADYLRERNVEAVHGGLIFLRRRSGSNWFDISELTRIADGPAGEAIRRGFVNRDLLLGNTDKNTIESQVLSLVDGVHQDASSQWKNDGWQLDTIALRIEEGIPATIGIDRHVQQFLDEFDGVRTVDQVIAAFAQQMGIPATAAKPQCMELIRGLLSSGLLTVV